MMAVWLWTALAGAQEVPEALAGARATTVTGAVVLGAATAVATPFLYKAWTTDKVLPRVLFGTIAVLSVTVGASVGTPLLVVGTRRGVDAWAGAGAAFPQTGVRFATTGLVMSGVGTGFTVAGLVLDANDGDRGERIAALGLGLLATGTLVAGAGAAMQWTAFPDAPPLAVGWRF